MPKEYDFGVVSIKRGGIDSVTGLPTALTDVGEIYRDTADMIPGDVDITDHFSELSSQPVIRTKRKGLTVLQFTLMDTSADVLAAYLGGTVTAVADEPDVWNEPDETPTIEASFEITTESGKVITIHRGDVTGKYIITPKRDSMNLLEVMVAIMKPLVENVPATTSKDAQPSA